MYYAAHAPAVSENLPLSGGFVKHTVTQKLPSSPPTGRHRLISVIADQSLTTLIYLYSGSVGRVVLSDSSHTKATLCAAASDRFPVVFRATPLTMDIILCSTLSRSCHTVP